MSSLARRVGGPTAVSSIHHLRRCRIAKLTHLRPRQPKVEQIGRGQKGAGNIQLRRARRHQTQHLVQRINGHKLDTRLRKNLGAWHKSKRTIHHPHRSPISIMHRITHQIVVPI